MYAGYGAALDSGVGMTLQQSAATGAPSPKLACRNVWKIFGPHPKRLMARHGNAPSLADLSADNHVGAVRGVTLEVFQGEIFVIMGLSGSGKSTLVRCMSRLVDPTIGEIILDDMDLSQVSEKALIALRRHKMGMVFQHFGLLPHRNVIDNVAFPLEVQGIGRKKREQRAREVLELVSLTDRAFNMPHALSGGEQQRVGIARSLAVEPEIWFLDEPFSALDPLIRNEMQEEFLRLQRLLHKTIVFITHDFDEAIRLADRIAIMKDGELIQVGTPETLVTRPADDYVVEFTSKVPKAKVISARTIMECAAPQSASCRPGEAENVIHCEQTVESLAPCLLASDQGCVVVDDDGNVIGRLHRESVLDVLFDGETP